MGVRFLRRMHRPLLLAALLCLAVGQAAPVPEAGAAVQDACGQSCPEEESGAPCDPLCDSCTCCSSAPQVPVTPTLGAPDALSMPYEPAPSRTPLPPAPSGILHVPKSSLA